ncbi:MAG TPA: hypothetical protein VNS57_00280 [Steroidobacteraceae bacterium]|nr:hypothetical protein [Steroidobacteraceae bacterium]
MPDRNTDLNDRKPGALASPRNEATPSSSAASPRGPDQRPISAREANPRRPPSKFGAAAEGWDAYNSWLDRVRQPAPPSRQAVIAKALYSVSSYKSWADKARDAFDATATAPTGSNGKLK